MAHWDKFIAASTPQGKLHDALKSRSRNRNTKSSRKIDSPFEPKNDSSISALFVQEMNRDLDQAQYAREIRDAIL